METYKFFLFCFFLSFTITLVTYAQTAQVEQSFIFSDEFNNTQELIIGYDPFGTDGLDPDLGEIIIPQVPSGEFGARFQLPADTAIYTIKDIRFGCGQPFYYKHLIDLSYINGSTSIEINWNWIWPTWYLFFINPFSGDTLAILENNWDPPHFAIPSSLGKIRIDVFYDGPLSWPEYRLYSPNGGEIIQAGETYEISWWNNQLSPSLNIEFSTDAGKSWNYIVQNLSTTQNSYDWLVPQVNSQHCVIRIGNYPCAFSQSAGTFVIYENNPPQLNPVEIPFWVIDAIGDSVNMIVGMHPYATNGLDTVLGEIEIPLPAPNEFAAALILGDSSVTLKDLQPGYSTYIGNKSYIFNVQPTLDSIVYFNMQIPLGVQAGLLYWYSTPIGIGYVDTTFISNDINFQFPPNTFYGGFFNGKGIRLKLYFDGTIPVELTTFTVSVSGNDVRLNWSTATETNNSGFEIEKKESSWNKIGFIPGHGTTTEQHHYSFIDESVSSGKYQYRLKQIDYDGSFEYSEIIEVVVGILTAFSLEQNYPNPFNPITTIRFTISELRFTVLKVYDVLGNEIATLINEEKPAGNYKVEFNADGLPSGIYFYQLLAGDPESSSGQGFVETKKMILLK